MGIDEARKPEEPLSIKNVLGLVGVNGGGNASEFAIFNAQIKRFHFGVVRADHSDIFDYCI